MPNDETPDITYLVRKLEDDLWLVVVVVGNLLQPHHQGVVEELRPTATMTPLLPNPFQGGILKINVEISEKHSGDNHFYT